MGLLSRLRQVGRERRDSAVSASDSGARSGSAVRAPDLAPAGPTLTLARHYDVVGESFNIDAINEVLGQERYRETVAVLLGEPTNPHDRNAIGVHVQGLLVGYVSRAENSDLLPLVEAAVRDYGVAAVRCSVQGGGTAHAGGRHVAAVVLEPAEAPKCSRPTITRLLIEAGHRPESLDQWGFSVRDAGDDRFRVIWTGTTPMTDDDFTNLFGEAEDSAMSGMARSLRDAGYEARVARGHDGATISVRG